MMRSTPRRSLLIHIASGALAAAFVLLPQAAFAQRGGGLSVGGGVGHFGGGGSFGGGGGHSGGGSHSSAPVHSGSAPHSNPAPTPVPASHAPATEAPPVASSHPIGSSPVSAGSAAGTSRVVGPAEAARGTGIAVSGNSAAASRSATIGFPPASGGTGTFFVVFVLAFAFAIRIAKFFGPGSRSLARFYRFASYHQCCTRARKLRPGDSRSE